MRPPFSKGANLIDLVFPIVIFSVVISCSALFGYMILEPIAKAVRGKSWSTRFCVADFFSLSILLAIPLVFVASVRRMHPLDSSVINGLGFFLVGVFAYTWWRGTVTLSRIGIFQTSRRCLFLGIIMPISVLGSALAIPTLIAIAFSIHEISNVVFTAWLIGIFATPVIAWFGRWATSWVVAGQSS